MNRRSAGAICERLRMNPFRSPALMSESSPPPEARALTYTEMMNSGRQQVALTAQVALARYGVESAGDTLDVVEVHLPVDRLTPEAVASDLRAGSCPSGRVLQSFMWQGQTYNPQGMPI